MVSGGPRLTAPTIVRVSADGLARIALKSATKPTIPRRGGLWAAARICPAKRR